MMDDRWMSLLSSFYSTMQSSYISGIQQEYLSYLEMTANTAKAKRQTILKKKPSWKLVMSVYFNKCSGMQYI